MYIHRGQIYKCTCASRRIANTRTHTYIQDLGGGNENSMIRWAVAPPPSLPPQMYSVGRLTRIYETHRTRARARAYTHVHVRIPAYTTLATTNSSRRCYLCTTASPYPFRPRSRLSHRRCLRRHPCVASSARSNPIIRVLRFVRSNSVCLIIRTARLFPTRAAVCFNTACLYARIHARE